jgi:hypothetical protein
MLLAGISLISSHKIVAVDPSGSFWGAVNPQKLVQAFEGDLLKAAVSAKAGHQVVELWITPVIR